MEDDEYTMHIDNKPIHKVLLLLAAFALAIVLSAVTYTLITLAK